MLIRLITITLLLLSFGLTGHSNDRNQETPVFKLDFDLPTRRDELFNMRFLRRYSDINHIDTLYDSTAKISFYAISSDGKTVALCLPAEDGGRGTTIRVIKDDTTTDFESSGSKKLHFYGGTISPNGTQYYYMLGEPDPFESDVTEFLYEIRIINLFTGEDRAVFTTKTIEERNKSFPNWFRQSIDSLNWWITGAFWLSDSTILKISRTGSQVLNINSLTCFEPLQLYRGDGNPPMISRSGRYVYFGPSYQDSRRKPESLFDLKKGKYLEAFQTKFFENNPLAQSSRVNYSWVGNDRDILLLEFTPQPRWDKLLKMNIPPSLPRTLQVIDVETLETIAEYESSQFTLPYSRRSWIAPPYSAVSATDSTYVTLPIDLSELGDR